MKITAGIPHCDWDAQRRAWVLDIRRRFPDAYVVKDRFRNYADTYRMAWRFAISKPGTTHAMLIEDDFMPCPNFRGLLYAAVTRWPEACVNLFCSRPKSVAAAQQAGVSWIRQDDNVWGATILPVDKADEFLRWERANCSRDYEGSDRRLLLYCHYHEIPVYSTVPSLTEHVGAKSSMIGHNGARFRTAVVLSDGSPIDFNTDAVTLPMVVSIPEVEAEVLARPTGLVC